MEAYNHELTGFATGCLFGYGMGVPPVGALGLGVLGAWSADVPDIDHAGAKATRALKWVPYWVDFPVDPKTGLYKTKTRKVRQSPWWQRALYALGLRKKKPKKEKKEVTRQVWKVRWFPARQMNGLVCWVSRSIWEACATPKDRRDTAGSWGPAFREHRGFSHTVWFCLLLGLIVWGLTLPLDGSGAALVLLGTGAPVPVLLGGTVALGAATHILGDGCTDFGISPFAPVLKWQGRRFPRLAVLPEPMRFKVSKWVEDVIISKLCFTLALLCGAATFLGPERVVGSLMAAVEGLWKGLA